MGQNTAQLPSNSSLLNGTRQKRIMIVDDEPSILQSLERTLAKLHYNIDTFCDPSVALANARYHAYDLVISDQRMPRMTGTELISELQKIQPDCATILLTGHSDVCTLMDAINKAHVYRFLTKPWVNDDLLHLIEEAIGFAEEQSAVQRLADRARVTDGSMTRHRAYMRDLEAKYPGITRVERDENGAITLNKYKNT